MGLINNIQALVQKMAWRRPGNKPLSEVMMFSLLTHMRHSASMNYIKHTRGQNTTNCPEYDDPKCRPYRRTAPLWLA